MTAPTVVYGIKTCDAVRKARRWLDAAGVAHRFHDVRQDGLSRETLSFFVRALGWETVLNRSSATFRALPEKERTGLDEAKAIDLVLREPTAMKRPILVAGEAILAGFDADAYGAAFSGAKTRGVRRK